MSKKQVFEVGQIIKNNIGEFTKILSIRDNYFGLTGWGNLVTAKRANVVSTFLNIFGLEACEVEITDEVSDVEETDETNTIIDDKDMPMAKYVITGEIFPLNEDGTQQDTALEVGSIQEVPTVVGDGWVEGGLADKVPTKTELNALKADALKELAAKLGLSTDGTKPEVLASVCAYYSL